jgi:hypothetical protein
MFNFLAIFQRAVFNRNPSNSSVRDFLEWFTETAMFNFFIESRLRNDAIQTLFEHKILEHSMQIEIFLPNAKLPANASLKTMQEDEGQLFVDQPGLPSAWPKWASGNRGVVPMLKVN